MPFLPIHSLLEEVKENSENLTRAAKVAEFFLTLTFLSLYPVNSS